MSQTIEFQDRDEIIVVNLKRPGLAALLAWLWPGAGHLYQGRTGKGLLFMVCVLGTFLFGLSLGGGHVVYASWTPEDRHLPYLCQIGVGIPAFPALVQNYLVRRGRAPLFGSTIMAPPEHVRPDTRDELARWHEQYGGMWDMGTLYTMVAGLLNVLAIYDAFAGPVVMESDEEDEEDERPPPEKAGPPDPLAEESKS